MPSDARDDLGLSLTIGQHSDRGAKPINQDFHGALIPGGRERALRGVALAVADGISPSPVSQIAAETAVKSFLSDYYCTSEAWTVRTAGARVIAAANGWLHAETRRGRDGYDLDRGYICTFSALVLKAQQAHLFHVGDSRISRLAAGRLEQLTNDHRVVLSSAESYLGRALGMGPEVEIDYRVLDLQVGDTFVLTTDGVHDHVPAPEIARTLAAATDLDAAARAMVARAIASGSPDNLTIQIVRVDRLPERDGAAFLDTAEILPPPRVPEAPCNFEGYRILRQIHASSRSHIFLAVDDETGGMVVLKIPSVDRRGDPAYLRRFAMEEWIARRISSPHVLKGAPAARPRRFLYTVTEHLDGQTLRQWMIDNPRPDLETVRGIVEQIVRGLRAFHRREMLHQDLRPENVMIDRHGTVKIIDFGAVSVAGVEEAAPAFLADGILGTEQYAAPEYFVGGPGTRASDQFSLGVIAYEMLTGRLPYGAQVSRARTPPAQSRLRYAAATETRSEIVGWVDAALRRAVDPDPRRRYPALSEFVAALRRPDPSVRHGRPRPLIERNPLLFWQGLSCGLAVLVLILLASG